MSGYTKNVAVIKQLKQGFSADGGEVTGLVRCEKYGAHLKAEATYLNFAPLTEGRLVCALSDGANCLIMEDGAFDGESEVDTSRGFAALICFIKGGVFPVASAVCGPFQSAALTLKDEVEKREKSSPAAQPAVYEDEALAEENYYEYAEADKDGGAVRENKEEEIKAEAGGRNAGADEEAESPVVGVPPLSSGRFYEKMKDEIEKVFGGYPPAEDLCGLIDNSRWARINYGDGKFYVFGVIYGEGKPLYICYGVPAPHTPQPPDEMKGLVSYIPVGENGYWMTYQDADTGAAVRVETE